MRWFFCSAAVRNAILARNGADFRVEPRLVDVPGAVVPGVGAATGKYAVPERVRDDSAFARWAAQLAAIPSYEAEAEALFLPPGPLPSAAEVAR